VTWADFVKAAYKAARDWGIQPSEFWAMSVQEWWWEADSKIAVSKRLKKGPSGFSEAEWEDARRRHREKMKAKADG
jgi:hypothetical protein